jgi:hypothetical protein
LSGFSWAKAKLAMKTLTAITANILATERSTLISFFRHSYESMPDAKESVNALAR